MEKSNTKERIHKFSKVIYILAKIGKIGCYVGIGFCIAGFIWMMVTGRPDGSFQVSDRLTIASPIAGITITENGAEIPMVVPAVSAVISYLLTLLIFSMCILKKVEILFKRIYSSYTPFELANAELIKKISILMILAAIIPNIVGVSVGATLSKVYNTSLSFEAHNSFSLFTVLVFFCVAEIFKYGCELQQQADETL